MTYILYTINIENKQIISSEEMQESSFYNLLTSEANLDALTRSNDSEYTMEEYISTITTKLQQGIKVTIGNKIFQIGMA